MEIEVTGCKYKAQNEKNHTDSIKNRIESHKQYA